MKFVLYILPLFLLTALFADEVEIIKDQTTLPLFTPALQARQVEKIRLNNGLEAILVSDPLVDQSAAALTVRVGSWQDPDAYPGTAHFLEHMLFLGTKKYPIESDYQRYLAENGGTSNAFTTNDYTSYMFSIHTQGFEEALDRFAHFFKTPLFNPSGVGRELKAIDQEFAKGTNSESTRQYLVLKAVTNKAHPQHRFSAGNSKTLKDVSPEMLRSWFEEYYSANLMTLYVISPLPLETLQKLVVQDFSDIENKEKTPSLFTENIFSKDLQGKKILIEAKKPVQTVSLLFELPPSLHDSLDEKPWDLICYVLGHEGKESVLAQLKREGLAEGLSCAKFALGRNNALLQIEVQLTKEGFKKQNLVIERVYQAIGRLKEAPFSKELFEEYSLLLKQRYQYQQPQVPFDWVTEQAFKLSHEAIETYPERLETIKTWDPDKIKQVLDVMTPEKAVIFVSATSQVLNSQDANSKELWKKEPWMDVAYSVQAIPQETLKEWSQVQLHPAITLPAINPWIASEVHPDLSPLYERELYPNLAFPELILETALTEAYYLEDPFYQVPRTWARFQIFSPELKEGQPQVSTLTDLYVYALKDLLSEMIYDARMADLNVAVEHKQGAIEFTIEGFTESFAKFFEPFIQEIVLPAATLEKFNVWKDALQREYENDKRELPVQQAFDLFKGVIYDKYSTITQRKNALKKLNYEAFLRFQNRLFKKIFIHQFYTGTLSREKATSLAKLLNDRLSLQTQGKFKPEEIQIHFPSEKSPYYLQGTTPANGNALLLVLEAEPFNPGTRNLQQLLEMAIHEAFFASLRTKQQTGYIVASDAIDLHRHLFNYFAVQSNTHTTFDLLWRTEQFLEEYLQHLDTDLTEARFDSLKNALKNKLKEPPPNLELFGEMLYKQAFELKNFQWMKLRLEHLEKLQYPEFIEFVRHYLGRKNKRRLAVLLSGQIPPENRFDYNVLKKVLKKEKKQ